MSRFSHKIDMRFTYVPAAATDIRKTMNRERKRLAEEKERREAEGKAISIEQALKVHALKAAK